MDNGIYSVVVPAVITVLGLSIGYVINRRTGKEANDIDRFEALLKGYDDARKADADRIKTLEAKVTGLEQRDKIRDAQLTRIKQIVQDWFRELSKAWPHDEIPMPLPTDEDLELLGITLPSNRLKT